jgi:hypothetical protein
VLLACDYVVDARESFPMLHTCGAVVATDWSKPVRGMLGLELSLVKDVWGLVQVLRNITSKIHMFFRVGMACRDRESRVKMHEVNCLTWEGDMGLETRGRGSSHSFGEELAAYWC